MSKNFTPGQTTANGCTQSPAPVFCCVNTTTIPVHKLDKTNDDASRHCDCEERSRKHVIASNAKQSASFFLWSAYRRKQVSLSYHPLPVTQPQPTAIDSSIAFNIHTTLSHLPKTTGINTSYFMKKLFSKSGMLAMMLMVVSLFFVSACVWPNKYMGLVRPMLIGVPHKLVFRDSSTKHTYVIIPGQCDWEEMIIQQLMSLRSVLH